MYNFDTTKEHKQAVRDYFEKGISLRQVAKMLDTSPQGAYSTILRIVREMYLNGEVRFKDNE